MDPKKNETDGIESHRLQELSRKLDDVLAEAALTRRTVEGVQRRQREADARARSFEADLRDRLEMLLARPSFEEGDEDEDGSRDLRPLSRTG